MKFLEIHKSYTCTSNLGLRCKACKISGLDQPDNLYKGISIILYFWHHNIGQGVKEQIKRIYGSKFSLNLYKSCYSLLKSYAKICSKANLRSINFLEYKISLRSQKPIRWFQLVYYSFFSHSSLSCETFPICYVVRLILSVNRARLW